MKIVKFFLYLPLNVLKYFGITAVLPFYLIISAFNKNKNAGHQYQSLSGRLFKSLGAVFLIPMWLSGYLMLFLIGKQIVLEKFNLVGDIIPIAGTGSMYPTFAKGSGKTLSELKNETVGMPEMQRYPGGITILGKQYFSSIIGRGDIISFENAKTLEITSKEGEPAGFVKRVIALPGDTIEIRDGSVYVNSEPVNEPYIARARSTFGGAFLKECSPLTIPANKVFVMGDNRKASLDSRSELELVDISDINHFIPLVKQIGTLDNHWRNTSYDLEDSAKIKIDKDEYLRLLNEKRQEAGVKPLRYQTKLERSAELRGEAILKYDDLSFEATRSGYTIQKAMADAKYSNIIYGETPVLGYFEAEELIDNQFSFPEMKSFLLEKDYQEFGIAEVEGTINGCPTQVVVQHFAGYIPPDYKPEEIASWKNGLNKLKEIQPSWQKIKEYTKFYDENKNDVNRINEIIQTRIINIQGIVASMESKKWLTKEQIDYTYQDEKLAQEQNDIAERLNSK